ncbi:DUF3102 domain-containing protein [Paenibacillus sp. IHB B 3084]|uniref:DUF3102 domain-containing protein n=1 Tax=Paenibacillus sp. IHB B 3084 TaxID=867076 RepID=UPI000A8A6AD2|nr:DUF3102 domain-containing protein [Paenibacillus sp. IHB B 3084]
MSEVATLPSDLPTITAEINAYKRVAGEAIFEIGCRLKHVKENDLAHGQYLAWLQKIDMSPRHAQQFVQLAGEFEGKAKSVAHLGFAKLLQIAQLPSDIDRASFVSASHTVPSTGAVKTVDEMTVRELREVKAALKAEKEARELAEARAERAEDDYERTMLNIERILSL